MMGSGGVWFVLILVLVLVGVAAALAIAGSSREGCDGRAQEILRQRLAAGEIDPEEYHERAELLGPARATGLSVRVWLPVVLIGLAVLLVVGLLAVGTSRPGGGWWGHMDGMMGPRVTDASAPEAVPDADEITIEMTEMAFDPDVIEITAGEPVNLTVTNLGAVFHDLTIDELDLQIGADSGETVTVGLEVDEPGRYEFYCSVPGHASAGMRGTLTVVEP